MYRRYSFISNDKVSITLARLIELKTFADPRGSLTVLEQGIDVGFKIKRLFYIYNVAGNAARAGHRHRRTRLGLICQRGSCVVLVNDGARKADFTLDNPSHCLVLEPEDWHIISGFTDDAMLLVLASEHYDVNDYIDEEYQ